MSSRSSCLRDLSRADSEDHLTPCEKEASALKRYGQALQDVMVAFETGGPLPGRPETAEGGWR